VSKFVQIFTIDFSKFVANEILNGLYIMTSSSFGFGKFGNICVAEVVNG
jgi:hypothetical protein